MTSETGDRNYLFTAAFVDALVRAGLRHVCISPGSRSTPLVLAIARHQDLRSWINLDERSSAFFALGIARALREPVVLVCSSGTATANFLPAVVEAHYAQVPLIVLTADRPPELWEWGANQTVDQTRIYGSHAKWSFTMPVPEAEPAILRFAASTASRAWATSQETPAGPVHLNFPFREPLVPESPTDRLDAVLKALESTSTSIHVGSRIVDQESVQSLANRLNQAKRGVIVCGPQDDPELATAIGDLASRLRLPVLADPLSQVRCGPHDRDRVIDSYDAFLRDETLATELAPDLLLRLGAAPTSKALFTWVADQHTAEQVLIGDGIWSDQDHVATSIGRGDAAHLVRALTQLVRPREDSRWTQRWLDMASTTRNALDANVEESDDLFEGRVFQELASLLPTEATLFAGNSMPVRDLDSFFPSGHKSVRFMANRGASGIDGVVSTALGASAALAEPLVLVLGDLSFYHDMNGLLAAQRHKLNATIIVLNNDGGGIFSFLPQAAQPDLFEEYFGTPHGLTFQKAAELYGLGYEKINSWDEFRKAVTTSVDTPGTTIVEVPGDRQRNVELHRSAQESVVQALSRRTETP